MAVRGGFITVVFVTCCLALVRAQDKCCGPQQMEMSAGFSTGLGPKHPSLMETWAPTLALDYTAQKVAAREVILINSGRPINVTAIMDYSQGMAYYVTRGFCKKEKLTTGMNGRCIPDGAHYNARVRLGSSQTGVDLDSWRMTFDTEVMEGETSFMVEPQSCYPVTEYIKFNNKKTQSGGVTNGMYFNIKPTISDPSIFVVPSICNSAEYVDPDALTPESRLLLARWSL